MSRKIFTRFPRLFSLLAVALSLITASCSDDDGIDGPVDMQLWDIVTYEGSGTDGKGSVFTLRQVDDSPLVTLTSTAGIREIDPQTRLMIRYIPENGKAYTSGPVRLLGASKINNGTAETEWKEEYDGWNRDKVFLYSVWRTGSYMNFHVRLTYSTDARIFKLVADPSTLDTEYPDLYLVHIMAEVTDYHDRAYFASFDIEDVWNSPKTRGVRIHLANTNLDKDIFTFHKTN